jgi:hypothetical protein
LLQPESWRGGRPRCCKVRALNTVPLLKTMPPAGTWFAFSTRRVSAGKPARTAMPSISNSSRCISKIMSVLSWPTHAGSRGNWNCRCSSSRWQADKRREFHPSEWPIRASIISPTQQTVTWSTSSKSYVVEREIKKEKEANVCLTVERSACTEINGLHAPCVDQ